MKLLLPYIYDCYYNGNWFPVKLFYGLFVVFKFVYFYRDKSCNSSMLSDDEDSNNLLLFPLLLVNDNYFDLFNFPFLLEDFLFIIVKYC